MNELSLDEMLKLADKAKDWEELQQRDDIERRYRGKVTFIPDGNDMKMLEIELINRDLMRYEIQIIYKDALIGSFRAREYRKGFFPRITVQEPGFKEIRAAYERAEKLVKAQIDTDCEEKMRTYKKNATEGLKIGKQILGGQHE